MRTLGKHMLNFSSMPAYGIPYKQAVEESIYNPYKSYLTDKRILERMRKLVILGYALDKLMDNPKIGVEDRLLTISKIERALHGI